MPGPTQTAAKLWRHGCDSAGMRCSGGSSLRAHLDAGIHAESTCRWEAVGGVACQEDAPLLEPATRELPNQRSRATSADIMAAAAAAKAVSVDGAS